MIDRKRIIRIDITIYIIRYNRFTAYGRSKLANVMFARELAKRVAGSNVTTCSLHPGTIDTELTRYIFSGWLSFMKVSQHFFFLQANNS